MESLLKWRNYPIMSATSAAGIETVTITQLQSSQDLAGSQITAETLSGILQQQQQQSLVMATPVSSVCSASIISVLCMLNIR